MPPRQTTSLFDVIHICTLRMHTAAAPHRRRDACMLHNMPPAARQQEGTPLSERGKPGLT